MHVYMQANLMQGGTCVNSGPVGTLLVFDNSKCVEGIMINLKR